MKITEIRTTPLAFTFRQPYVWAGRCDLGAAVVLVEVETDDGIVGIGESTAGFPADSVTSCLQGVSHHFIGESPFDIERLFIRARYLESFNRTPWYANLVLAGLEMALWDVIGKSVHRPVYQLLGGVFREEVDYFGFLQGETQEDLAKDAERKVADDFSVIYMKVGRGEDADVANVAAVSDVIGGRRIRLDANQAWDVHTAIHMINRLSIFGPEWIEQPTPAEKIGALRQVKEAVNVPIAVDQGVFTPEDVYEVCRQQAADVIVLSPHEAGGLLGFKKAAAVAEAAGLSVCLHGQSVTGVTDCAQHHLGTSLPNLTDGNQIMHQLLEEDILSAPNLELRSGKLDLIPGPGFGFELNWDAVGRASERYRRYCAGQFSRGR